MPPLTAPTNALISLDPSELNPQNRFQDGRQANRQDQVRRGPEIDPGRVQDFLNAPSDSGEVPAVTPAELSQDSQLRLNADGGGNTNPGTEPTFDNSSLTAGFTTTADQAQAGAPGTFGAEVLTARPSNDGAAAADTQQAAQTPADGDNATTTANDTPEQFQDLVDQVNATQDEVRQNTIQTQGDESIQDAIVNRNADRIDADQPQQAQEQQQAEEGNANAGADQQDVTDAQQAANADPQAANTQDATNQGNAQTAGNFDGDILNAPQPGNAQTAGNFDGNVLATTPDTPGAEITEAGGNSNEAAGTANDAVNANDAANPDNVAGLPDDGAQNVTTDGTTFSAEERAQFQQLTERVNALQTEIDNEQGIGGATIQDGILNGDESGTETQAREPSTNDQFAADNANAPGSVGGSANDAAGNVLPDNPIQALNG